jgi:hypothetical protein
MTKAKSSGSEKECHPSVPGPCTPTTGARTPGIFFCMIRKLKSGEFRLYSRKKNASTGKRRNLGTFSTREKAEQHERAVQYFKRH